MHEERILIDGAVRLGATLCLPDGAAWQLPAVLLIGGTGGDTRDGDLAPQESGFQPPLRGTLRHIAHRLAGGGIATLRWDKRGVGESEGTAGEGSYDTDLDDAKACYEWLRSREGIDASRVAVAGHSAGGMLACQMCRDVPGVAAAMLLSAVYEPIDTMLRWNWGRPVRHWHEFTPAQQQTLLRTLARQIVGGFCAEQYIEAARRGEPSVTLTAHGRSFEFSTARFRQDLTRPPADDFQYVKCPAFILHGGADLNVRVEDAMSAYKAIKGTGNEDVELMVLPGLDHSYLEAPRDKRQRIWERVSLECWARPMSQRALDAMASWALRVLKP